MEIPRLRPFAALLGWLVAAWLVGMPATGRCDTQPVIERTLSNGLRLIVQREPDTPLVAIDVFVGTAGAPEDASRPGIANFTANVLLSGTSNEDSDALAEAVGELGGDVSAYWDRNFTQLRSLTLASRFDDSVDLLSDVLMNAAFTNQAVETNRAQLLQDVQDQADDVFNQAYDQLKMRLYQSDSITPEDIGDPDVIKELSAQDLRRFYEKYYTADNTVISVVGNIDPSKAIDYLARSFAQMRPTARRAPAVLPDPVIPPYQTVTLKSYRGDITAGYIMVGYIVPGAGRPEYPALMLLNALLGGMKTSLLFTNLRIDKGLAYDTASMYGADVGVTDLTGYILTAGDPAESPVSSGAKMLTALSGPGATAPSSGPSFSGVRDALLAQFKAIQQTPPTPAMLTRAQRYVIGTYLISHERLEDRAYWLGYSETALKPLGGYMFDANFAQAIDAVTAQDVQRVAQKYLSQPYVISMVLPGDPNAGEVSR